MANFCLFKMMLNHLFDVFAFNDLLKSERKNIFENKKTNKIITVNTIFINQRIY